MKRGRNGLLPVRSTLMAVQYQTVSNDIQVMLVRLSRLYVAGYTFTYVHVKTTNEKEGMDLRARRVCGRV